MTKGVEYPETIDLVAVDRITEDYLLVILENRPWQGGKEQLLQLQAKLNSYLEFALDGEMARLYPDSVGYHVTIRLYHKYEPGNAAREFLRQVGVVARKAGIGLEVVPWGDDLPTSVH